MAKEERIILPIAAGIALLVMLSRNERRVLQVPPVPKPTGNAIDFIKKYWAEALESQRLTTIPALTTITQGGLESGWGKSAPKFNFFGIKAGKSWKGPTQLLWTTEYIQGQPVKVQALFRAYPNAQASFADHGNFFLVNPRYNTALQYRNDNINFVKEIAKAGYATDPKYADKLITAMKIVVQVLQNHKMI